MLRDITIGQYYQGNSFIHKLDPRVKLFGTLIFIISLFLFGNFVSYCLATFFLSICIYTAKVPFRYMMRGMKSIMLLLAFTILLDLFLTPGVVLVKIWKLHITVQGVTLALHVTVRFVYLILASSLMTLTTTPLHLTDALEKALGPLQKIKVPVHEIAMMMSIALRFIPILIEEADHIMKAQSARGMDFEHGTIIQRIKNFLPLLVPLFAGAIRRADDLAMAMDARCYRGGVGRTKMNPLKYKKADALAYIALLLYFAAVWGGALLSKALF